MDANTGYMNLNKIIWGLQYGFKFRTLHYPDLYSLAVSTNILPFSPTDCLDNILSFLHSQFWFLKTSVFSKITKSCQTLVHKLWTSRQKSKQNLNYTLGVKPAIKTMEFHGKIKYLPYHSNSQRCATEAVAYVPRLFASNDQSWEAGRGKRLDRLGKAPATSHMRSAA